MLHALLVQALHQTLTLQLAHPDVAVRHVVVGRSAVVDAVVVDHLDAGDLRLLLHGDTGGRVCRVDHQDLDSLVIESAIWLNLLLEPCAFWMSALMPAAAKALVSRGWSYSVYRVDVVVSGRITPICGLPPVPPDFGGFELLLLLEPQALSARTAAVPMTATVEALLRINIHAFLSADQPDRSAGRARQR
jgi:hypothetical protein